VQSAKGVLRRFGLVVLHKVAAYAAAAVFFGMVRFEKESARIAVHVGLDDDQPVDVRGDKLHVVTLRRLWTRLRFMIPEGPCAGL